MRALPVLSPECVHLRKREGKERERLGRCAAHSTEVALHQSRRAFDISGRVRRAVPPAHTETEMAFNTDPIAFELTKLAVVILHCCSTLSLFSLRILDDLFLIVST